MARVKLIQDRTDVAPEHYALFDELAALRGRISGPSTVVLHSPGLARPWNEISEYLHRDSIVAPADAELAVSATAREKDCPYVWNAHVPAARKAGVSEATITAVRERRPLEGLPASEALVVRYVQQLVQGNRVESGVFEALLAAHDPKWMVELTVWIGRYAALAGILNGFEVTAANPVETLPVDGTPPPRPSTGPVRAPSASPRVPPVTGPEQLAEADRPVFAALVDRTGGGIARPFMAYSPQLAQRVFDVSDWLRTDCEIAPALRELAALAVAREKDAPAVWASHVDLARRHGASEAAIAAVRDRAPVDALSVDERDVIDYVRQQLRTHHVTQDLFDRLRDRHGVRWLVELTCLVGHYGVVCSVVNAFELAPPPGADPLTLG
jgi:4-carboxymuconolactone decarboxylase